MEKINQIQSMRVDQLPQNFMENIQDKRGFKNNLESIQKGAILKERMDGF